MNYVDGQKIRVGDKVKLWEGCSGVVVCSMDDDEFAPEYPREEWSYLKTGVMIDSDQAGLIHYPRLADKLQLIARKQSQRVPPP